jgi:hypothetical protein
MSEMFRAADDVIEAFVAPDVSGPRKNAFKPMRRERFPGMKDVYSSGFSSACQAISVRMEEMGRLISHLQTLGGTAAIEHYQRKIK